MPEFMSDLSMQIEFENWPLAKPFVIARGSKTQAGVVTVILTEGHKLGRGECVPYARYGESAASVIGQIEAMRGAIEGGMGRAELQEAMPAGAARNALDCALWDLASKRDGKDVYERLGFEIPVSVPSVQTISVGTPKEMRKEAASLRRFPVIKIKLDAERVLERTEAVHLGAPNAELIIDANESWSIDLLEQVAPGLAALNVVMIEQPLKADDDQKLAGYASPVPLGADESCHTADDLDRLQECYQYINIKLDKTGGLTEALKMQSRARGMGYGIMVGSMVSTSLALAPAVILALDADYVDLDSPSLLAEDRPHAMTLQNGRLADIDSRLWGGA